MATAATTKSTTISYAPAGETYRSIEHAGQSMLKNFCGEFPRTGKSYMLPQLFISDYPESSTAQRNQRGLTEREENKYVGMMRNKKGEAAEKSVYNVLHTIIRQENTCVPILVLRNYKYDCDNVKSVRKDALKAELRGIDLTETNFKSEQDFVILVKYLGVVYIEVKVASTDKNIVKAEDQLHSGDKFAKSLMSVIMGCTSTMIPTAKLVIVPSDTSTSPTTKTKYGSHIVHNDVLCHFEEKWEEIVEELRQEKLTNPFSDVEFERMTHVMTGIWAAKPISPKSYKPKYDQTSASLTHQITEIDDAVKKAIISSDEKKKQKTKTNPVTDIVRTKETDIFQSTEDIKLLYLTPAQKELYENYTQCIIRGNAGSGKTLLILFKVMELMRNEEKQNIILIAPHPHHIRCKNVLLANDVNVEIIKTFPTLPLSSRIKSQVRKFFGSLPSPSATSKFLPCGKVLIMELQDFFGVKEEILMKYDLTGYHIFVDDMQTYDKTLGSDNADFNTIGDFIEQTYVELNRNQLYAWFGVDIVQGYFGGISSSAPTTLFYNKQDKQKKNYSIPIVTLKQILRNTEEVAKVVTEARDERISDNSRMASQVISNIEIGHQISSQTVCYHKLMKGTDDIHKEAFMCERIREELHLIIGQQYGLTLSNVSILFDHDDYLNPYKQTIKHLLLSTFNIQTQTIEEELLSGNSNGIVLDEWKNVMSYEVPCVILVKCSYSASSYYYYNLTSRARTRLTIIDLETHSDSIPYKNIDLIKWKHNNNTFYKI